MHGNLTLRINTDQIIKHMGLVTRNRATGRVQPFNGITIAVTSNTGNLIKTQRIDVLGRRKCPLATMLPPYRSSSIFSRLRHFARIAHRQRAVRQKRLLIGLHVTTLAFDIS